MQYNIEIIPIGKIVDITANFTTVGVVNTKDAFPMIGWDIPINDCIDSMLNAITHNYVLDKISRLKGKRVIYGDLLHDNTQSIFFKGAPDLQLFSGLLNQLPANWFNQDFVRIAFSYSFRFDPNFLGNAFLATNDSFDTTVIEACELFLPVMVFE